MHGLTKEQLIDATKTMDSAVEEIDKLRAERDRYLELCQKRGKTIVDMHATSMKRLRENEALKDQVQLGTGTLRYENIIEALEKKNRILKEEAETHKRWNLIIKTENQALKRELDLEHHEAIILKSELATAKEQVNYMHAESLEGEIKQLKDRIEFGKGVLKSGRDLMFEFAAESEDLREDIKTLKKEVETHSHYTDNLEAKIRHLENEVRKQLGYRLAK